MTDLLRLPIDDRLAVIVDESHCIVLEYEGPEEFEVQPAYRHTLTHVGRVIGALRQAWGAVASAAAGAPKDDAFSIGGPVTMGQPITTEQATRAILRMLHTPLLGDIEKDPNPGYTLGRIYDEAHGVYDMLSSGEKRLADIAWAIWRPQGSPRGEGLSGLGGIERDNRRRVLIALWYLHMGRDLPIEIGTVEWDRMFGDVPVVRP